MPQMMPHQWSLMLLSTLLLLIILMNMIFFFSFPSFNCYINNHTPKNIKWIFKW